MGAKVKNFRLLHPEMSLSPVQRICAWGRCEPCSGQSLCPAAAPGVLEMGWRQCWIFLAGHQERSAGEKRCTNLQLTQGKH